MMLSTRGKSDVYTSTLFKNYSKARYSAITMDAIILELIQGLITKIKPLHTISQKTDITMWIQFIGKQIHLELKSTVDSYKVTNFETDVLSQKTIVGPKPGNKLLKVCKDLADGFSHIRMVLMNLSGREFSKFTTDPSRLSDYITGQLKVISLNATNQTFAVPAEFVSLVNQLMLTPKGKPTDQVLVEDLIVMSDVSLALEALLVNYNTNKAAYDAVIDTTQNSKTYAANYFLYQVDILATLINLQLALSMIYEPDQILSLVPENLDIKDVVGVENRIHLMETLACVLRSMETVSYHLTYALSMHFADSMSEILGIPMAIENFVLLKKWVDELENIDCLSINKTINNFLAKITNYKSKKGNIHKFFIGDTILRTIAKKIKINPSNSTIKIPISELEMARYMDEPFLKELKTEIDGFLKTNDAYRIPDKIIDEIIDIQSEKFNIPNSFTEMMASIKEMIEFSSNTIDTLLNNIRISVDTVLAGNIKSRVNIDFTLDHCPIPVPEYDDFGVCFPVFDPLKSNNSNIHYVMGHRDWEFTQDALRNTILTTNKQIEILDKLSSRYKALIDKNLSDAWVKLFDDLGLSSPIHYKKGSYTVPKFATNSTTIDIKKAFLTDDSLLQTLDQLSGMNALVMLLNLGNPSLAEGIATQLSGAVLLLIDFDEKSKDKVNVIKGHGYPYGCTYLDLAKYNIEHKATYRKVKDTNVTVLAVEYLPTPPTGENTTGSFIRSRYIVQPFKVKDEDLKSDPNYQATCWGISLPFAHISLRPSRVKESRFFLGDAIVPESFLLGDLIISNSSLDLVSGDLIYTTEGLDKMAGSVPCSLYVTEHDTDMKRFTVFSKLQKLPVFISGAIQETSNKVSDELDPLTVWTQTVLERDKSDNKVIEEVSKTTQQIPEQLRKTNEIVKDRIESPKEVDTQKVLAGKVADSISSTKSTKDVKDDNKRPKKNKKKTKMPPSAKTSKTKDDKDLYKQGDLDNLEETDSPNE